MATNAEINAFIKTLGNLAIAECNRRIKAGKGFVVPSVCIGQSAHETGWGDSALMKKANAFFGIKAGGSWTGKVFRADTWEMADGESYNTVANFRAYDSLADSVADYYNLIVDNPRYANAVSTHPDDVKSAYDTLYAIWAGGYATDEEYVPHVWNLMNGRNLQQFDDKVDGVTIPGADTGTEDATVDQIDYIPAISIVENPLYTFQKVDKLVVPVVPDPTPDVNGGSGGSTGF